MAQGGGKCTSIHVFLVTITIICSNFTTNWSVCTCLQVRNVMKQVNIRLFFWVCYNTLKFPNDCMHFNVLMSVLSSFLSNAPDYIILHHSDLFPLIVSSLLWYFLFYLYFFFLHIVMFPCGVIVYLFSFCLCPSFILWLILSMPRHFHSHSLSLRRSALFFVVSSFVFRYHCFLFYPIQFIFFQKSFPLLPYILWFTQ